MIQTYLKSLLNDPGHSGPWTDIEDRDRFQPKTTKAVSGFKIMYSTIEMYPGLRSWIHEACPSIIHVIRRNFLKQHISQLRMRRDKLDHTNKTDVGYRPVRIDLDQFMYLLRLRDTIESKYRERYSTSGRYFELYYEDFFSSFEKCKQRLLAFLGLENEGMPLPDIKKISSNDIRKEIENWREVIDHLMNSEYDYLLNAFSDNGRVLV
jgi:hypothetical protein